MTPLPARRLPRVFALSLVLTLRLGAQDAAVSPLQWVYPDDPPDSFPVLAHAFHPAFPYELRSTEDLGYVIEQAFVDETGKTLSLATFSSVPVYEHEVAAVAAGWDGNDFWRFRPALRGGQPVNALVRLTVAFNPASATPTGPDATPRLLTAREVVLPDKLGTGDPDPSRFAVTWATVALDAQGRPGEVSGVSPDLVPFITKSLAEWTFAPGRRSGQAVAAHVRVPFVLTHSVYAIPRDKVPPRVTRQVRPVYPAALRGSRLRGEVLVQFEVDIEGRVRNPFVVHSLNGAFDAPALEAVSRWRFEPGRVKGVPVPAAMLVPIVFDLNGLENGGSDGTETLHHGDSSKLPDDLRVDVEPRITALVVAVYPYADLVNDTSGSADVAYIVSDQGNVVASKVVETDRPELGLALQAAVERFTYDPGLRDGHPHRTALRFHQDFRTDDDNLVSRDDIRLLRLERKHPERIAKAGGIDRPVKLLGGRPPTFPRSLNGKLAAGTATVEFLIDEHGHPRLARIADSSAPEFGYAAAETVALWSFEPPTAKGLPVVVRVRAPFIFKSDSATGSP
jgi:TonB family protein